MKQKTIYRTVIEVEVLSEEPIGDVELSEVASGIITGDWSGKYDIKISDQPLTGKEAANALIAQDSDPEFFQMDRDGNDLDEEEDN